jgi:hypothetical protein
LIFALQEKTHVEIGSERGAGENTENMWSQGNMVTGKEIHKLYCPHNNVIRVMGSRRKRRAEYTAFNGKMTNAHSKIYSDNVNGRSHLKVLGVDRRITE